MTAQSKPEAEKISPEQAASLARKHKITSTIINGAVLNIFAWLVMLPARPEMVLRVSNNDPDLTARTLASMTGAAAVVEFFMSGLLGRLSDKIGRRPIMLGAPLVACVARLGTAYGADKGRSLVVGTNWLDRCTAGSAFPVYFGALNAAMADLWMGEDPTELAKLGAKIGGMIGLGIGLAPFCGAQIMVRTGKPKYVPLVAALVSALHFLYVYAKLPETLPDEQKKEFDWAGAQPFAFLQFFTKKGANGLRMRLLALAILVKALTTDMHDTRMVLLRTKLGFGPAEVGKYMLASGGAVMASGVAGGISVSKLGLVAHTYLGSICAALEQLSWSVTSDAKGVVAACTFGILAGGASAGTGQLLQSLAVADGIGKGQVGAMMSNMNTVVRVPGPLIFATLFGKFGQRAPFHLAALLIGASALIYTAVDKTPVDLQAALAKQKEAKKD